MAYALRKFQGFGPMQNLSWHFVLVVASLMICHRTAFPFSIGEIQAKGKPGPKVQPSSKPRSSSCQVPTRSLVSQLPVPAPMPKAIGRNIPLSRHAIPRTASQLKQLSVGVSGRKGSAIPAVKRGKRTSGRSRWKLTPLSLHPLLHHYQLCLITLP